MNIEFYTDDPAALEFFPPQPANKAIPDWYRDIPMRRTNTFDKIDVRTIKHCAPVQDMITSGYIIFNSYEVTLTAGQTGKYEDFKGTCPHSQYVGFHHHEQFPVELDGKAKHYFKISNQWMIKTPPGYSCLIQQPFYHLEQGYQLLPAIVDTDKHDMLVEIPGYLTSDKSITIESGAPLVQIIPFKREDWDMTAVHKPKHKSRLEFVFEQAYRKLFHSKKSFK